MKLTFLSIFFTLDTEIGLFFGRIGETFTHSQMEQYFFSYLLTWEVDLIEILEIMAQMWPQFLDLLSRKV